MRRSGVAALVARHRTAARNVLVDFTANATSTLVVRVRQHAALLALNMGVTDIHNMRR
jgi:hypothetical protein